MSLAAIKLTCKASTCQTHSINSVICTLIICIQQGSWTCQVSSSKKLHEARERKRDTATKGLIGGCPAPLRKHLNQKNKQQLLIHCFYLRCLCRFSAITPFTSAERLCAAECCRTACGTKQYNYYGISSKTCF